MNHVGRGGAALALYDLIRELKIKYNDIDLIVITGRKNELNQMLTNVGIPNHWAPFKNFMSSYRSPSLIWRFLLQIRYLLNKPIAINRIEKLIDFTSIDIIHSNLNRIDIGDFFSKKYNIPHIWHIREYEHHDFRLMPIFVYYNPLINNTEQQLKYIAISKMVKSFWSARGIPEAKMELIYDGISVEPWITNKKNKSKNKLSFIFLGGYHINKGQEVFINALGLLPQDISNQVSFHFFGDGDKKYIRKLNLLIKKLSLCDCVKINDYQSNVYELLDNYHIGVNCSNAEGFGRITVEYMMAGLCPLVSNRGANLEIIQDSINGVVFNRDDLYDIKNKILFLFNNQHLIDIYSKKAKETAFNNYSMSKHAHHVYQLYEEMINS
jgi:glycosyltransferase involved in cell wall biosynthesis